MNKETTKYTVEDGLEERFYTGIRRMSTDTLFVADHEQVVLVADEDQIMIWVVDKKHYSELLRYLERERPSAILQGVVQCIRLQRA